MCNIWALTIPRPLIVLQGPQSVWTSYTSAHQCLSTLTAVRLSPCQLQGIERMPCAVPLLMYVLKLMQPVASNTHRQPVHTGDIPAAHRFNTTVPVPVQVNIAASIASRSARQAGTEEDVHAMTNSRMYPAWQKRLQQRQLAAPLKGRLHQVRWSPHHEQAGSFMLCRPASWPMKLPSQKQPWLWMAHKLVLSELKGNAGVPQT